MTDNKLTYDEAKLIQQRRDQEGGDEAARALLERSEPARVWEQALGEVQLAARGAAQEIEERVAAWPAAAAISDAAQGATPLAARPLVDLLPLLDRFLDGEVDEAELEAVAAMLEAREDVAAYLEALDEVGVGVKAASQDVSAMFESGDFWAGINARLDADAAPQAPNNVVQLGAKLDAKRASTNERPAFSAENHQVMIYRHYDGEVSAAERAQVAAWAEIDPKVATTLKVMEELTLAVRVAVERAQDRADLGEVLRGVHAALEQVLAERKAGVVSLQKAREAKVERESLWTAHRRDIVAAAVAALVTIIGLGVFGDKLFKGETVVVRERTVVIVDSVESAAGASVMVSGPMTVEPSSPAKEGEGEQPAQEAEPTVIWLLEGDEPKADGRKPI